MSLTIHRNTLPVKGMYPKHLFLLGDGYEWSWDSWLLMNFLNIFSFWITVYLQAAREIGQEGREGVWEGAGQGQEGEQVQGTEAAELYAM